jgi:hypothetical protein
MRILVKSVIVSAAVVLLVTAFSAGTKATTSADRSPKYIEVCSRGTVYLPPGTEYVTCRGRVMKVLGIVPLVPGQESAGSGDCACPNCCGGACTVTVSCQSKIDTSEEATENSSGPRSSGAGSLCVVYLSCGD